MKNRKRVMPDGAAQWQESTLVADADLLAAYAQDVAEFFAILHRWALEEEAEMNGPAE